MLCRNFFAAAVAFASVFKVHAGRISNADLCSGSFCDALFLTCKNDEKYLRGMSGGYVDLAPNPRGWEKWKIIPLGSDMFAIQNINWSNHWSKKGYLSAHNSAADGEDGWDIKMVSSIGDAEKWYIDKNDDGTYSFDAVKWGGGYLRGQHSTGKVMHMYRKGAEERWYLDPVGTYWNWRSNDHDSITKDLTVRAFIAGMLADQVYYDASTDTPSTLSGHDYDLLDFWSDADDQAMVAKVDGICYAAFRGSDVDATWGGDIVQNLDAGIVNAPGGGCKGHKGFISAYNTYYKDALESKLRDCHNSCGDRPCEVILTGHSAGGSAAVVASTTLYDLNPVTMTFGAPETLKSGCGTVRAHRHFRFVLAGEAYPGWGYDWAAALNVPQCVHYGREILLGPDTSAVVIGTGTFLRSPMNAGLHSFRSFYEPRLESIKGRQVEGEGWGRGSGCSYNEECRDGYCAKYLGAGKCCNGDEYNDAGTCKGRIGRNQLCVEDRVCYNNRCDCVRWYGFIPHPACC